MKTQTTSIDSDEIAKFEKIAEEWWDPEGKFKPLHRMNPLRIKYLKRLICAHYDLDFDSNKALENLDILDIGCGGGLIAVPFTKMSATMTAIDASDKNIKIAKTYATRNNLDINYQTATAEKLAAEKKQYSIIFALEIIEHVKSPSEFINVISQLVKPGGMMFISTINRTMKAYLFAILGAERVMRWLPVGTHDYDKLVKPSEIDQECRKYNLELKEFKGIHYNLFKDEFSLTDNLDINYIASYIKQS